MNNTVPQARAAITAALENSKRKEMKNQTDAELAAAGRMIAAELEKVSIELAKRGIERDVSCWADGKFKVEFNRVTTEGI